MVARIPLPAAGEASVVLLTMRATARHGAAGPITVRMTNDAKVPPEIRAVAVIINRIPRQQTTLFNVYVLINNLAGGTRALSDASMSTADIQVRTAYANRYTTRLNGYVKSKDCNSLIKLGNDADEPEGSLDTLNLHYELQALRDSGEQPSDPEAVLDHTVYKLCPAAETPEDGPG